MYSKENIVEWLKAIGADASYEEEERTEWIIRGAHAGITFAIVRVKGDDRIIIQRAISIIGDHMDHQQGADPAVRSDFKYELKRSLALSHARYRFDLDPEDTSIINNMIVESYVYDDGATKHNFIDAYFNVVDAAILCMIIVERYFD